MNKFNFDEWAELYKTDPAQFELKRKQLLEETILSAPVAHRARLRLIQVECDAIHNTHTPLAGTVEISRLMSAKLGELKTSLTHLRARCEDL